MKSFISLVLFVFILLGCHSDKDLVKSIRTGENLLKELANKINSESRLQNNMGKLVRVEDLSQATRNIISSLLSDVQYVVLDKKKCADNFSFEIYFGNNGHLVFDCNHGVQGHEVQDNIESFEINDEWYLWINHDIIG